MAKAPAFQHRHYAPLAARINKEIAYKRAAGNDVGAEALADLACALELDFVADNPGFDPSRWLAAWKGQPSKKDSRTAARLVV